MATPFTLSQRKSRSYESSLPLIVVSRSVHTRPPVPGLPAQEGMACQDEAEALIERIGREIGDIADLRLWDAAARACQGRYVVDLDLEFSPEPEIVHRWSETFVTPAEWAAYYTEQTRNGCAKDFCTENCPGKREVVVR